MMLSLILDFYRGASERLYQGEDLKNILKSEYLEFIGGMRFIPTEEMDKIRQNWIRVQEDWLVG